MTSALLTCDHLDELADLEHEVERRVLLEEEWVEAVGQGDGFPHPPTHHQLPNRLPVSD